MKGTPFVFYGTYRRKDDTGIVDEHSSRFAKVRYVWNVEQVTDLPEDKLVPLADLAPIEDPAQRYGSVDAWVETTGARIAETGTAAFYCPNTDTITVPPIDAFLSGNGAAREDHFYSTLLHELTHWTGHKKRLDRLESGGSRSASYAFEELVAELGSVMLGCLLGIQHQPREDNAAYLKGWMSKISAEPATLFKAAADAGRAMTFLQDLQPELEKAA